MKQLIATVTNTREVMPQTFLLWMDCHDIADQARPGQYVMVNCGDSVLPRPLSIHQISNETIALLFRVVGKGTAWLSQRKDGDKIKLLGPLGNGFTVNPSSKNLLLVAGGIGIAPIFCLAQDLLKKDIKFSLLYGSTDENRITISPKITCISATDSGAVGYRGLITDLVSGHAKDADQVFACGPLPMYLTMAKMKELKGKSVQLSLETRMACGRGICNGCTIKTKHGLKKVCQDGPVFELDDVLWNEAKFIC